MSYINNGVKFSSNNTSLLARGTEPLTDEQIMRVAPSIYAPEAHISRSDRYVYIPTINVLNAMRKEGFLPFFVAQSRSRIEGKQNYTKHLIRYRHINDIGKATGRIHEIAQINSHDGTSSYQLISGLFEYICSNGLCIGESLMDDVRIRHSGNEQNINFDVIEAAYEIIKENEEVDNMVEGFISTPLDYKERALLAETALEIKYGTEEDREEKEVNVPIKANDLLMKRRSEDYNRENNLYGTFNIIQENVIRGGIKGRTANNKRTRTRAVNSIDNDVKYNKALWNMTQKFYELKNG